MKNRMPAVQVLKSGLWILFGSAVYCVGFNWLFAPNQIAFGGLTGIAQVLHTIWPALPIGSLVFVLNIPLFLLGWRFLGGHLLVSSLFAMVLTSAGIDLLDRICQFSPMSDTLLASITGGAVTGLAMGIIFLQGATTGGSDLGARLLKLRLPWLPLGKVLLGIDFVVVVVAAIAFRQVESALYGLVALVVSSFLTDAVLYGLDTSKVAYIITDQTDAVLEILVHQMGRGVTILHGQGAWSGQEKRVLMCAFKQRLIMDIKRVAKKTDPDALRIVCDAREILGDGFGAYSKNSI